ncbi:universal stress protein [Lentzea albidocapillata]|uniref:Nucleotide-binding universal stress protein, UspA family n=1 Tax=Lentzea albidocapillata TaxID=40571 RepID=A0A1W2F936_9PSEU|nr:universal stress protein [Lentzea albidocapillata]SMD18431.1 Nucleotide-binding universal stress protein, UspA family [Lentzea albidocapillata]
MSAANPFVESSRRGGVVAGFDGSDRAREAIRWAAAEAAHRRRPLLLVHAHLTAVTSAWGTVAAPGWGAAAVFDDTPLLRQAEEQVCAAAQECRRLEPGLDVETQVVAGRAAPILLEAARTVDADLLVVGRSGPGVLPRTVIGCTATGLVHQADQPVVAVHSGPVDRSGPVVVGVDGTAETITALQFASAYADRHGCELRPVHQDVDTLLAHSERAQLLVVRDRGHGVVHRAVFGSVSRAALSRASCSVAVVPNVPVSV